MKKSIVNSRGFTLMEILVAITLLSIGLLSAAGLSVGIIRGNAHSNRLTTAVTLAQDKLEDYRRMGYAGTASTDTTTTENYKSISNFAFFKRVAFVDVDSPMTGMKTVTVTVYWDSDTSSTVLQTILAQ